MRFTTLYFSKGLLIIGALLCVVLTGCLGANMVSSNSSTSDTDGSVFATVKVGTTAGRQIPSTFMGFSHEWGTAQKIMGSSSTAVDEAYRQLLKNLMFYGADTIHVRIGGNSTDSSGEPDATTVQPFVELANTLGVNFTLGVNLGSNNVQLAVDQARFYAQQMPPAYLGAIEIGNEPDTYAANGYRPSGYSYNDYLADFDEWKVNILPVIPSSVRLMGASWASTSSLVNLSNYTSNEMSSLSTLSQHYYVGNAATVTDTKILLTSNAATYGPNAVATSVNIAHNAGLPFRMGELNSLYNGGLSGVSNTFQSSLWALDTMFEYWNVGVDGVNWQVGSYSGNPYNPFNITSSSSSGKTAYTVVVNPLYYGLLLFQQATANRAYLLPVTLKTSANLKTWATIDTYGCVRILVINKDTSMEGNVSISAGNYSKATVTRLLAPSYSSTKGITLGGQTFDDSSDGILQGAASTEAYSADAGSFSIPIKAVSAMLVQLN